MIRFLQRTPNLRHLDITITHEIIDGHQWEQIIRNYLPKLKTFRFKIEYGISWHESVQKGADYLFDSFRSSFSIDERQWFFRCSTKKSIIIYLDTISSEPYPHETISDSWKWTCSANDYQKYYNNITIIDNQTFFDKPIPFNIRLSNIRYLHMKFPINDQFRSIVPNLNQLRILVISYHFNTFQSQLQAILDRAPCFYRICINQCTSLRLQTSLFKYTKTSVRELDLRYCHHYFNENECIIALTRSSLGVQCEVLIFHSS